MKRFFAIFICIATALIFVACTNNSETKSSKTETTQISAQNSGGEKSFASIEDYINAEETQKAIDSMKKFIAVVICAVMIVSATACTGSILEETTSDVNSSDEKSV